MSSSPVVHRILRAKNAKDQQARSNTTPGPASSPQPHEPLKEQAVSVQNDGSRNNELNELFKGHHGKIRSARILHPLVTQPLATAH
jgi:hypothetical protein